MPADANSEASYDPDALRREAAFLDGLVELIGCLDVRTAMQRVADLGHLVIGARTCNVRLLNESGDALDLVGTRGATCEEHLRKWRSLRCTESIAGVVFQRREFYETENIQRDPHYGMKEFAATRQLVALRADPILVDGSCLGVITLYFVNPEEITSERRVLASMLARFAGGVLEMQRREQQWTGGTSQALSDPEFALAQNVQDAAAAVVRRALMLSKCQAARLSLPRGEIGGIESAADAGEVELLDHPRVADLARSAFTMNAVQDSSVDAQEGLLFPGRHASAFPCSLAVQRVGVLTVVSVKDGPLEPAVSRSLIYLAARSAEVLLRLQDKERREALDEFLATLGVGAQDRLVAENVSAYLLDFTRKRLGVEGAVLYLWDAETTRYTPRSARGLKNIRRPIDYAKQGYRLGEGFVGNIARQGKPELLRNPDRALVDADRCLTLLRQQTHTRELTLCVGTPIYTQGSGKNAQPIGVAVFADGRPGAGVHPGLEEWQGGALLSLATQVESIGRAQEILERQDELFRRAAHKAKGPLAKIAQAIRVIEQRGWRAGDVALLGQWAEEAMENVKKLLQVQRALSEQPIEPKEADMTALVTAAVEGFQLMAEAQGCALRAQIQPDCRVVTSESHARDILDIVLDNAVRYSPRPGGSVEVSLRVTGEICELSVRDNGRGLSENVRESMISASGAQLRAGYDFQRGLGLGLFVVRSYARTLGWHIEIANRAPAGTSFSFRMACSPGSFSVEGQSA